MDGAERAGPTTKEHSMAGALRKTMVYLGLAEDQGRYDDDYDEAYDDHVDQADHHEHAPERAERRGAEVTHLPTRHSVAHVVSSPEVGGLSRITTIHPRTYNEAKTVGENFRDGIPVIMNLTDMSDADAKRLVDFAAGLVFGLRGSIERVTSKVFLLSPETVEVNAEEGPVVATGRGVFNQS
jgi:cell division inhibitor SepF